MIKAGSPITRDLVPSPLHALWWRPNCPPFTPPNGLSCRLLLCGFSQEGAVPPRSEAASTLRLHARGQEGTAQDGRTLHPHEYPLQ